MNRKLKINLRSYALIACALFAAGCAKPYKGVTVEKICPAGIDKQQAMQIAEDVLAKMYFTVAKSDANLGVIKTRPLAGAQFFEFWRKDNVGSFDSAEANLHTIRRIAEINVKHQDTLLCLSCNVNVQRLNMPEQEFRSSSRVYEMFSQSSSTQQTFVMNPRQKESMAWVNLGNDANLATVILKRIENKIAKMQKGKSL
ncbi:MAG: hypothetical protein PHQ35_06765 [Phycisphaerae bacterium]|nr:hypothetical protein [Phycisphaerae bacterium]MDD5381093.1 hypothetical protein [Phycisphaerae bacterium]